MTNFKRRVVGLVIIAVGICAAMPFRTDIAQPPAETSDLKGGDRVLPSSQTSFALRSGFSQQEPSLQLQLAIEPLVSATPSPARQPAPEVRPAAETFKRLVLRKEALKEPPRVASNFERFTETVPSESVSLADEQEVSKAERRHQISDGDTLERIALRYFGDREQWRAIFEANRNVLSTPDILPIGQEITIPRLSDDDGLVPVQ
jgi:phage tail protein X